MRGIILAIFVVLLAGCAGRPPSPQDLQAKRFEAIPDKAVVYVYRDIADFSDNPAAFMLDGQHQGSTYPGTYYRLELAPGPHRIAGFAGDAGRLDFLTYPGNLYFIRQSVSRFFAFDQSIFHLVSEGQGRHGVMRAELLGAR